MIGFILFLLFVGLLAGFVARAGDPARLGRTVGATIVLGIVGSFVGGFLGRALLGTDKGQGYLQASGIVGSIIGAVLALLVYRAANGRRITI